MKNYYEVLGVNNDASSAQIKKRTLQLGKQLHPSTKQPEVIDDSKDFVDVVEAFEVLYDEKSRKIYDRLLNSKTNSPIHDNFENYIHMISQRSRKSGEKYAKSKFKVFKNDLKEFHWWDITSILEAIIPW
ncbi:MAG: hypothetical protein COA32_14240 [Fluviicola sp.]|nr:MAG: hypothetical protein COA32_14240 [Fluviicola sp.]